MIEVPEEIYCKNCKLHSCPNEKIMDKYIQLSCFWCDNKLDQVQFIKFFFGKYGGRMVKDIKDLSYLNWLVNNYKSRSKQSEIMMEAVKNQIKILTNE